MNKTTLSLLFVFTALLSNAQILNEESMLSVKQESKCILSDTLTLPAKASVHSGANEIFKDHAPSPESHALMQYSDIPVSLYTGIPDISIPIYTINVGNFSLPISLRYHASGIKVAQEASRVGLGWSLHAGGCISRTIQERDDFDEFGFYMCSDDFPDHYESPLLETDNISNSKLDTESDIYHYNFAGYSGKFIVRKGEYEREDESRFMLLNPEDNLRIEGCDNCFTITAEDNTKFIFNDIEQRATCNMCFEDEKQGSETLGYDSDYVPYDETNFSYPTTVTSWLLSKIILPNGNSIQFNYVMLTNSYLSPAYESYTKYKILEEQYFFFDPIISKDECKPKDRRYWSMDLNKTEYILNSITWNQGTIEFKRNLNERFDITGYEKGRRVPSENRALEYINIYPIYGDSPILSYKLHHSYFVGKYRYNQEVVYDTTNYLAARLRLDSITINNAQKYTMEYDMSNNLPLKNDHFTDKWGFYTTNNFKKESFYPCTITDNWYAYKTDNIAAGGISIDKTKIVVPKGQTYYYQDEYDPKPDTAAKTWILTGLTTPTGASTRFKYDCNDIYTTKLDTVYTSTKMQDFTINNISSDTILKIPVEIDNNYAYCIKLEYQENKVFNNTNNKIGIYTLPGYIRCFSYPQSTITETNGDSIKKTFTLEGLINQNAYLDTFTLKLESIRNAQVYINLSIQKIETALKKDIVGGVRISQIKSPLSTINYFYAENGYSTGLLLREPRHSHPTIYYFYTYCAGLYIVNAVFYTVAFNSFTTRSAYNPYNGNHIGYSKVYSTTLCSGDSITESHTFFNKPETDYYYYNDQGTHNPLNGTMTRHVQFYNEIPQKDIIYKYDTISTEKIKCLKIGDANYSRCYYVKNFYTYLDSMSIKEDENVKSFKYTYHDSIFKLKTARIYATGHPTKRIEYSYSVDYPSYLGGTFKDSQLKTVPLMEKYYTGNTLEKAIVKTHHNSTIVKPYKEYSFIGNQGLDKNPVTLSMDSSTTADVTYNSYTAKGQPTELISRGGRRVVLLWSYNNQYIVAQINNATLQEVINCGINVDELAEKPFPDDADWNKLHNLRNVLPNAQVTVSRYEPLVGMVSQTDARGVETRYTYDEFNRLHQVIEVVGDAENIIEQIEYHYATEE